MSVTSLPRILAIRQLRLELLAHVALRRVTAAQIALEACVPETVVLRFFRDPFYRVEDEQLEALGMWLGLQKLLVDVQVMRAEIFAPRMPAVPSRTTRMLR